MQLSTALLAILPLALAQNATTSSAASPTTSGRVISIDVGEGGLIFSPNSTTANVGDVLQFSFYPQNHSVAQAIYTNPCQPANDAAIFSGFMPVSSGEGNTTFSVTVNGTDPLWFYCSQARHCESGMVFVVNENTPSGQTLTEFASTAQSVAQNVSPARVQGGVRAQAANSSSATSSAAPTSSGSSAPTGSSASASASASPTGNVAAKNLGWGSAGSVGVATLVLRALL